MHGTPPVPGDLLVISQADSRPMYLQIVEQVKQRVAMGDWAPGFEVPSIRQMAVDLQVSVITVKRAYLELERAGVIVTQQGKGSRVAQGPGLGPQLLEQDLGLHLKQAARLGRQLGLSEQDLVKRLRDAAVLERAQVRPPRTPDEE
jgi:GntR family transcriptional regulator